MNKGISFYYGFKSDPKERAKKIKNAHFDTVIANADPRFDSQNGTIEEQIEYFKENGIKVSSLHNQYISAELPEFYKEGEIGDRLEATLIKDLHIAKKYGFRCVVLHLKGEPNEIGLNRLRRALKVARELDVPIAIENVSQKEPFIHAMANIDDDYLRFCYDIGHNHCFFPDFDFLSKYKDKLECLHLHSNDGTADMHTLNKYGNVDFHHLAEILASLDKDINLDYELLLNVRGDETEEEVLDIVYQQACELENMVNEYRNKN